MDRENLAWQKRGQRPGHGPLPIGGMGHCLWEGGYHLHFDDVITPPPCTLSILRFPSAPKVARRARRWMTFWFSAHPAPMH
ncbi:hypothetical protein D3C78_1910900 [compost metagenome]